MVSAVCRAKDPKVCPHHGLIIKMYEAQASGDMNAYFVLRSQVEEQERQGWVEEETKKIPSYTAITADGSVVVPDQKMTGDLEKTPLWHGEVLSNQSVEAQRGDLLDSIRWVDPEDNFDTGIVFHRQREGVYPSEPSFIRIQANKELNEEDVRQLSGLLGYAYRKTVAGESLDDPKLDTPYSFVIFADTTKSRRDDLGWALEALENEYPKLISEGTPVYKTDRKGPKGSQLIEPFYDDKLEVSFYYDSIIETKTN